MICSFRGTLFLKNSRNSVFPLVYLLILEFGPKGCSHLSYRNCFKGASGSADKLYVCWVGIETPSLLCQGVTPQEHLSWTSVHAWWITYSEKHSLWAPTKTTCSSELLSTRAAMICPHAAFQHHQTVMYTAQLHLHYKTVDTAFHFPGFGPRRSRPSDCPGSLLPLPQRNELSPGLRRYGYDTHPFCDPYVRKTVCYPGKNSMFVGD